MSSYFKGFGSKSRSFGGRKNPLVGLIINKKHSIFNEYVPGSGVGASNVTLRRLKKKRAKIRICEKNKSNIKELIDNEILVIDNDASIEEIKKTIISNPSSNIDLDSDSNVSTDIETILAVANYMLNNSLVSDGEIITEKLFFSNYDVISSNTINMLGDNGFAVANRTSSVQNGATASSEFIFKLELIESGTKIVLTEQMYYT
jgi:hypothetical protein